MREAEFKIVDTFIKKNTQKQGSDDYKEASLLRAEYATAYISQVLYSKDDPDDALAGLKELPAEEKIYLYESIATQQDYASKKYLEMLKETIDVDEAYKEQQAAFTKEMDEKQDAFTKRPDVEAKLADTKAKWESLDTEQRQEALQEIVTAYSRHLGFEDSTVVKIVDDKPNNYGAYTHDQNGGTYTVNKNSLEFADFDKVANTTFHEMRHRLQAEKLDAAVANREEDSTPLVTRMIHANYNGYVSDDYDLYAGQFIEEDARHAGEKAEQFVAGINVAKANITSSPELAKLSFVDLSIIADNSRTA